jgi:hypothetical protein
MKKTDHILISIGVCEDYAPHEHLWCTRCGGHAKLPTPAPISCVTGFMKGFNKDHRNCQPDEKNKLGFLNLSINNCGHSETKVIWGGLIPVQHIAKHAFEVASAHNGLLEPYTRKEYCTVTKDRAEACIIDMITNQIHFKDADWFSMNYSDILGYTNMPLNDREKNWPGIRFRIFLKIAYALIWTGARKPCKK